MDMNNHMSNCNIYIPHNIINPQKPKSKKPMLNYKTQKQCTDHIKTLQDLIKKDSNIKNIKDKENWLLKNVGDQIFKQLYDWKLGII